MKGKDIVTLTTEQMEQNVQYTRKKYQESKIEPIMAVDEVLNCGLVNIQCVGNKTINIRNLINEAKFDVFMLTETWLWGDASDSSKIKEMTLKTHTFYHFRRVEKTGGGVGVFVSKSLSKVTVKKRLIFNTFEYIDLEILSKNKVMRRIAVQYIDHQQLVERGKKRNLLRNLETIWIL